MPGFALDTTVVLRLLTGLPEDQAQSARAWLVARRAEQQRPIVSDLVIAEAYYALCYHYDVPKTIAVRQLRDFLDSGSVTADGVAVDALTAYSGTGPGLVDRIINLQHQRLARQTATFDRDFARLANTVLLRT
ncbi:MAG: hypothetical protein A3K19_09160 [Lentisphaerae bacterium RIFOXYB12_FULL_65_16]|nr:MAG: hypothetical protein A3K18_14720 [Lentisphaerae bacterium RIFOXYA12_64_32]OGV90354.1 MAG: hypothetical protein A3K19_09160 [Lentisphaerae bacterium RIFOXYB12_FULL_65_16]